MVFLRDFSWDEVFHVWQASESHNPGWIRTATEIKGWPDWKSWRMFTANQLKLPQRDWKLYEFENPMDEIPNMLIGPFTGWQSRLPKPNAHTFADLVEMPEQHDHFNANTSVQKMRLSFPANTMMTALQKPGGRLVLIEGHHRATAIALAKQDNTQITFPGPVQVAVAELNQEEQTLLDDVLRRGSTKEPPKG